jgi:hypothetical protein
MSIGSDLPNPEPSPRRKGWDWILWWQVDPVDLDEQVRLYGELGIRQSMRGISVLCLLFSMAMTTLFIVLAANRLDAFSFVDVAIMGALALFIYLGHRWAMIGAMAVWTLEKVVTIASQPITAPIQLLWWALFMHAFYFAFRVEQRRRMPARAPAVTP